jgi:hypothetical protein
MPINVKQFDDTAERRHVNCSASNTEKKPLESAMSMPVLLDAIKVANLSTVRLALKNIQLAREYCAHNLQRYDELMGLGLPTKNPVDFIYEQNWATRHGSDRVELPVALHTSGGTRLDELLVLATVTRVLRPAKVFEIGTFLGRTTSVFVMNTPPSARVISMDLPVDIDVANATPAYLDTDVELVRQRKVGAMLHECELTDRYEQIYGDSLTFDPSPHAGSVELGFIDGAHTLRYVTNDTLKMATMMSDRGLVFWHDYGGKGSFRELTDYLEQIARRIAVYRVAGTTLAWSPASEVAKLAPAGSGEKVRVG